MSFAFKKWQTATSDELNNRLAGLIAGQEIESSVLKEAIKYSVLDSGKRIRPLLLIATGHMFGKKTQQLLDAACALELIHCYSLIHDDLPAMDDDDLRRGKPSCHKQFGEAAAILTGDALQALAFESLTHDDVSNGIKIELIKILSQEAGASGMVDGQALDIEYEASSPDIKELEQMHEKKTACLFTAALTMAAALSGVNEKTVINRLKKTGLLLGRSFQIHDDILDVTASSEKTGKPGGSDAIMAKSTYVSLFGLEKAQSMARRYNAEIFAGIAEFNGNTEALLGVVEYITNRNF